MLSEDIIFDDVSAENGEGGRDEHHLDEGKSDEGAKDVQMADSDHESRIIGLETLTYYPRIRRSERRTAGKAPNLYGFEVACVVSNADGKGEKPTKYAVEARGTEALMWRASVKIEINAENRLTTWELVTVNRGAMLLRRSGYTKSRKQKREICKAQSMDFCSETHQNYGHRLC